MPRLLTKYPARDEFAQGGIKCLRELEMFQFKRKKYVLMLHKRAEAIPNMGVSITSLMLACV